MIHYSCDRCRRLIDCESEIRYFVRIEARANLDTPHDLCEDPEDHLSELEAILDGLEPAEQAELTAQAYQLKQFDLCPTCFQNFIDDPLQADVKSKLEFSDN